MESKMTSNGKTVIEEENGSFDTPIQPDVSSASIFKLESKTDEIIGSNETRAQVSDFSIESEEKSWKETLTWAIDHNATTIYMTLLTVYALFGDDIRVLAFAKSADDIFFGLSVVALFSFLMELLLSCAAKPDYFNSFYFWLDLVATVSLIPDIGWIMNPITGQEDSEENSDDAEQVQNAGKASRAGTRTSRIIRIIRLVRLIRIVKLYKNAQKALKERENDEVHDERDLHIPSESRVGKKLSDRTTKRVIMLVLTMLLILPLFEESFYNDKYKSWDYGPAALDKFQGRSGYDQAVEEFIDYHEDRRRPLIKLSRDLGDDETWTWEGDTDPDDLRTPEKHYGTSGDFVAIIDLREDTKLESGLNIVKTVFVCIVLALGAIYFTKDANELVLKPIERMIDKVAKIARNPISHVNEEDQVDFFKLEQDSDSQSCWARNCRAKQEEVQYETDILENTIVKIGHLLALGFGEAGSAIIGTNMAREGDVNPMIDGTKMIAIFGFCDIR
jgi:hypothetical protein